MGLQVQDERMGRRPPYRHSRVSGNPAVACQDCGIIRQYRSGFPLTREGRLRATLSLDSRLRGKDGRGRP